MSLVAPRSSELLLGERILHRRLLERLRFSEGVSYSPTSTYVSLDRDSAHVLVATDALPAAAQAASDGLVAVVDDLASGGISEDELNMTIEAIERQLEVPASVIAELDSAAVDELIGRPHLNRHQLRDSFRSATLAGVGQALAAARSSAILCVPRGVNVPPDKFHPYPVFSSSAVSGRRFTPVGGNAGSLVLGEEGISVVTVSGSAVTVHFADCAAVLWWLDGTVHLVNKEGMTIKFVPAQWFGAGEIDAAIRAKVPADRFVPMQEPGEVPQPPLPRCEVCGGTPAERLDFKTVLGIIIYGQIRSHRGVLCRDCGLSSFRRLTNQTLLAGWWSVVGFFMNIAAVINNWNQWRMLRRLAPPTRSGQYPPLPAGRPLYQRPGVFVATAVWLFVIGVLVAAITSAPRS
jgi:hypothetical protein